MILCPAALCLIYLAAIALCVLRRLITHRPRPFGDLENSPIVGFSIFGVLAFFQILDPPVDQIDMRHWLFFVYFSAVLLTAGVLYELYAACRRR